VQGVELRVLRERLARQFAALDDDLATELFRLANDGAVDVIAVFEQLIAVDCHRLQAKPCNFKSK